MNGPLVSIVMCTYNTNSYVREAVDCVLRQTYPNTEVIISDDYSTDGTREYLKSIAHHPKVKIYLQKKNIGYVANKNFAIQKSSGEYITQNDSDDYSDLTRLDKMVNIVTNHPEVKIVACGFSRVDAKGTIKATISPAENILIPTYTGQPYPFWFPPLLVHKQVYTEIGLFSEYFQGMGDDLYWTIRANSRYPIFCLKEPLYYYRDTPGSITNVLENDRKLIIPTLLKEVIKVFRDEGVDLLSNSEKTRLETIERKLLQNNKLLGEQYRVWAAKAIDQGNLIKARLFLKKSFGLSPFNFDGFRTLAYLLRKSI